MECKRLNRSSRTRFIIRCKPCNHQPPRRCSQARGRPLECKTFILVTIYWYTHSYNRHLYISTLAEPWRRIPSSLSICMTDYIKSANSLVLRRSHHQLNRSLSWRRLDPRNDVTLEELWTQVWAASVSMHLLEWMHIRQIQAFWEARTVSTELARSSTCLWSQAVVDSIQPIIMTWPNDHTSCTTRVRTTRRCH